MTLHVWQDGDELFAADINANFAAVATTDPVTGQIPASAVPSSVADAISAAAAAASAAQTTANTAETAATAAETAAAQAQTTANAAATAAAAASAAAAEAQVAAAAVGGLTPPTASMFTYWFRRDESASPTVNVSPGGPSNLIDVPGVGMEIDCQSRTNDLWSVRFAGFACPTAPFELICAVQPADVGYSPFWMVGPCLMETATLKGIWSKFVIGRDQPLCYAELDEVTFPADQASNTTWTTSSIGGIGAWQRAHFLQRVYHRFVFDSAGYLTVFQSSIGKGGPWRILNSDKVDTLLGAAGTGQMPDQIGLAFSGLQEGNPLMRQTSLVAHWDVHAYTGPVQPTT